MTSYYYKKSGLNRRRAAQIAAVIMSIAGFLTAAYIFFPTILWQVYFAPAVAAAEITAPVPNVSIVTPSVIQSLISNAANSITGVDYTNAQNWFPAFKAKSSGSTQILSYTISIPKLGIKDAKVTTTDNDLSKHLVNYSGTATPPDNGNAVIFGHSTLPQLFNPSDYKKIFATLHTLKIADIITVNIAGVTYNYKVFNIRITEPDDTSVFTQNYDASYLTLVTCAPPGTVWKRLVVKARLERI